jgi:hypothetical protein
VGYGLTMSWDSIGASPCLAPKTTAHAISGRPRRNAVESF